MQPWFVAGVGCASDPLTWSGIVYHFKTYGQHTGFVQDGLELHPYTSLLKIKKYLWNAKRVCMGERYGGFQYSDCFLNTLWAPEQARIQGRTVVNCFQLYAPCVLDMPHVQKWFYIDQTLPQLFDYYHQRACIGKRIAQEALALEKEGYDKAQGVVAMSHFAAHSLVQACGVPQHKVHVVVPGANLDPHLYNAWYTQTVWQERNTQPMTMVMVTTDWRRKGLDRLLRALALGRKQGLKMQLKVVGCTQKDIPQAWSEVSGVQWYGKINKRYEQKKFLQVVSDADIGCLLSRYEAGGMVLREFHALGLAVLATDAGGMLDHMHVPSAYVLEHTASDEEVLHALQTLENNPEKVRFLRAQAWATRQDASWECSVRKIQKKMDEVGG